MPWSVGDVDGFKKGLSDKQKRQWVHVANGALKRCKAKGGDTSKCDGKAIRQANSVVGTPKKEILMEQENLSEKERNVMEFLTNEIQRIFKPFFKKEKEEQIGDFMLWKEADGTTRWVARYSNNFRDDDVPAEIISKQSHERFVKLVDGGEADYPELWLWHIPDWKFGQADWVAYDDTGFALAAGSIDKGCEDVAVWLSKQKGVCMSHGMPNSTIKRDPNDQTIIIEHESKELSVLPDRASANKLTGFILVDNYSKEDDEMSIPKDKVDALIQEWNANPELLQALAEHNIADAEKAVDEGREQKEVDAEVTEETSTDVAEAKTEESEENKETETEVTEPEATEVAVEEPTTEAEISLEDVPTRQEIADAFASIMGPYVEEVQAVSAKFDELAKEISNLQKSKQEDIEDTVANSTPASIAAMIAKNMSAVGSEEAKVDGRSSLAQSHPKETEPAYQGTGIPFIDEMLKQEKVT